MSWNDNYYRQTPNDIENLSYPPTGGRVKMVLLGVILPVVIAYFAVDAWITEVAWWPGSRGSGFVTHGSAAKAVAAAYLSAGMFCHSRWFWGLFPVYRVFEIGTVVSLLGFLGALIAGVCFLFS